MPNYPDSDRTLDRALQTARPGAILHRTLILERSWLDPPDTLTLDAGYRFERDDAGTRIAAAIGRSEVFLDEPVPLVPVDVAKPWGREIWFTGIEARGESRVRTRDGELPLSQYLALAPRRLCGRCPLVLLKILDPRPEPVLGDLYFEAHEQKQEVYVVSHVDAAAWPDGRGGIRYGMNQELRQRYRDDAAFRRDYLSAVQRYEAVRRAVDGGDAGSSAREAALRAEMEAFTHLRELTVGDVVVVPTWLPHSLQHGVRVVEFQTPTYERYIISFGQRVLTQAHWDSAAAIARMRVDLPEPAGFDTIEHGVERIVAFDDFRVWRITVDAGASFTIPAHVSYGVCVVLAGELDIGPLVLGAEQAVFVPGAALEPGRRQRQARLVNRGSAPATVLLAAPDL